LQQDCNTSCSYLCFLRYLQSHRDTWEQVQWQFSCLVMSTPSTAGDLDCFALSQRPVVDSQTSPVQESDTYLILNILGWAEKSQRKSNCMLQYTYCQHSAIKLCIYVRAHLHTLWHISGFCRKEVFFGRIGGGSSV
jgi:hypothetical protein